MATTGTITVDLLAKTGSFTTDIDRAAKLAEKRSKEMEASLNRLTVKTIAVGSSMGDAITAGIQKAIALLPDLINGLDALNGVKDATGSTIENISALEDVALRTGTSMDTVSGIMVKFNGVLKDATGKNSISLALQKIGLDAAELRKMDPAEALRVTAVALSVFADDGNKARITQELFGKSVKETAPFLKNLSEQTELVGKVSADQAGNAEAFNKQIFALQKNALDAKRALLSDLLPAINEILKAMANGGIGAAIDQFGERALGWTTNAKRKELANLRAEIDSLAGSVERKARFPGELVMTRPQDVADLAAKRAELDAKTKAFLNLTDKNYEAQGGVTPPKPESRPTVGDTPKPQKADHSAAQEAKAQLALDLDDIKKSTGLLTDAFDNREKIMAAQRSASLISEADFFAGKRALQVESDQLEQAGIEKQIARLQQEKLTGKDRIDNDRKIADARAALAKARATSATNLTVLDTQAEASAKAIARAFTDARDAAQSFLDVTNRARALEVAGMGRGEKSRGVDAAISQIEEKYEQQRQDLQRDNRNGKFAGRQEDYARELALINEFQKKSIDSYRDYYDQIELRQKSFTLGAAEAARNYFDESQNAFKQTQEAVSSAFKGMEDALVDFVKTGKLDFKSLVDSIITDIARIAIKQQITGPLAGMLSGAFGFGGASGPTTDQMSAFDLVIGGIAGARAGGGPVGSGKTYLVGEKGPELFTPNTAGAIIPNDALGGGGQPLTVHQHFTVGDVASVSMLRDAVAGSERRIAGAMGRSQRYGGALAA